MLIEKKQAFASRMRLSPGRLSQPIAGGMPARADGRVDVCEAAAWIRDNLDMKNGRATVDRAREVVMLAMVSNAAGYAVHEAPAMAMIAAAEAGVPREQAERLADLLLILLGSAVVDELTRAGVSNVEQAFQLPHPAAWRQNINWPNLYDEAGASVTAGSMAAP